MNNMLQVIKITLKNENGSIYNARIGDKDRFNLRLSEEIIDTSKIGLREVMVDELMIEADVDSIKFEVDKWFHVISEPLNIEILYGEKKSGDILEGKKIQFSNKLRIVNCDNKTIKGNMLILKNCAFEIPYKTEIMIIPFE